ncbi:hypothetical protein ACTG13_14885 [Aeromonas hydrophila]|uniref:hypothetical protein n=1 Tax=Aeromonas hydrophila TaxID=644 RepID=UPI003F79057F
MKSELMCIIEGLTPIISMIAAVASASAVFKANEISTSLKKFQKNSMLNAREIELAMQMLEALKIYDEWCKEDAAGSDVNFHTSRQTIYES